MATYYWVGGSGTWNNTTKTNWSTTSGGAGGSGPPTNADDAIFDANSGTTPTITVATSAVSLNTTITTTGINFSLSGNVTMCASGGTLTHSAGTLTLNNNQLTVGAYLGNAAVAKTIAFGTGKFILTGNAKTIFNISASSTATITGTPTIDCTYSGSTGTRTISTASSVASTLIVNVTAGSDTVSIDNAKTYNFTGFSGTASLSNATTTLTGDLTLSSSMTINSNNTTARTIAFNGAAGVTQTITTNGVTIGQYLDFDATGASNTTVLLNGDLTLGSLRAFSHSSGTLDLNDYVLTCGIFISNNDLTLDFGTTSKIVVTYSGGGTTSIVNCSKMSGTIVGTPIIEVTGAGTGGSTLTINWGNNATTSTAKAVKLSILKTVSYTYDITGNFNDFSVSGSNPTLTFNSAGGGSFPSGAIFYKNVNFSNASSVTGSQSIQFASASGNQTLTSGGVTIGASVEIATTGTSVLLADALTISSAKTLTLTSGTFDASGYNVSTGFFVYTGSATRTLTMGSGTWTLSGAGIVWSGATTGLTFNKNTANIVISGTSSSTNFTFSGANSTYNKLTISTSGTAAVVINGTPSFSEIASTRTDAHTISLGSAVTVDNWTIKGTAGNVVTLNSATTGTLQTITKNGGGYLTGIDYLAVRSVTGSPTDTWYIGANSTYLTTGGNNGYGMFTTQRVDNAVVVLTSTTSTTWTVPNDWNSANNTIHLIGGGGGGSGSYSSSANAAGGGGGGGGGYTKLTNQSLSKGASITYQCGSAGSAGTAGVNGTAGGTTSWNSGASTAGGGGGGQATATSSTGGTAGTGTTFNGGVGGAGSTTTSNTTTGCGGGGGAGAAGPSGAGKNGGIGFSSTTAASIAGGGGGGSNGGTAGGNASAGVGGTGGNNFSGVGGGASNTDGSVGGGGGGSVNTSSYGGAGVETFGVGSGGGGGGADDAARSANIGGTFGGGGGGAGVTIGPTTRGGAAGAQGAIIITYVPSASGSFFIMF